MKKLLVRPEITLQKALKSMSEAGEKCLIVVDDNNKMLGTLSDGDLRKAILNVGALSESISDTYNPNATFFVSGHFSMKEAREIFIKDRFQLIPVVNDALEVVDILYWDKVFENHICPEKRRVNASVVIMAGGKGRRLEPFTKVLPKPLIPIQDKPIIEHIIERFMSVGISDFHLTVNYKSRILKAFFEDLQPEYSINFVEEDKPLGTAGSLRFFVGAFKEPFIVTNCDILIDADYAELYTFHQNNGYDITLVASMMNYIIPYGTCELNGDGYLKCLKEKPGFDFLVNTGLYVINPDVLKHIPRDKEYHITALIDDVKRNNMKVGVYPVADDAWIDTGQWTEYKKAVEKLGI